MKTSRALDQFDRLLAKAGFDIDHPVPLLAWRTFKEFAGMRFDCAGDSLLFQCGVFRFTGTELFHFDFTRQFTHEEDSEYAGMEQLHCTIYYTPTPDLRGLDTNLWSHDCSSLDDFFRRVEQLPEFNLPLRSHVPLRAELDQEDV
jgi:hypothetical protein